MGKKIYLKVSVGKNRGYAFAKILPHYFVYLSCRPSILPGGKNCFGGDLDFFFPPTNHLLFFCYKTKILFEAPKENEEGKLQLAAKPKYCNKIKLLLETLKLLKYG